MILLHSALTLLECHLLLGPIESTGHAAADAMRKSLVANDFQVRAYFGGAEVSRNDTRLEDICVFLRHRVSWRFFSRRSSWKSWSRLRPRSTSPCTGGAARRPRRPAGRERSSRPGEPRRPGWRPEEARTRDRALRGKGRRTPPVCRRGRRVARRVTSW